MDLIKKSRKLLQLVRMLLNEGEVNDAIDSLSMVEGFLSQANVLNLARQAAEIITLLRNNQKESAMKLFGTLEAELSQLYSVEEKAVLIKEKSHLRLVHEFTCPYCRKKIPEDSNFCSYCGGKIERYSCPSCKEEVLRGWNFCVHCRASLR